MGFCWAVYAAHAVTTSLIWQAFGSVRQSFIDPPRFLETSQVSRFMKLRAGDMCVLHVIDDINAVSFGVRHEHMITFQQAVMSALYNLNLPIKRSKTNPVGTLLRDVVPFIGFRWRLREGVLIPK